MPNGLRDYLDDFYWASSVRDRGKMTNALIDIEKAIDEPEGEQILFKYFSSVYAGRSSYNIMMNISDYPVESILRELLQNAFDCYYEKPGIKLAVHFKDDNVISISYNETGFSLEQFLSYLSIGHSTGDASREGRFGVGAKSVFLNSRSLFLRSNNFSFHIENNRGALNITELSVTKPLFRGTEILITVDKAIYDGIRENLLTLTEKKGAFINLVELCFAFNRKKVMDSRVVDKEEPSRVFNIAVLTGGKMDAVYTIAHHRHEQAKLNAIRFSMNKRSVVDFVCHEHEGVIFLVPFAVANTKRDEIMNLLYAGYNYFSTYELTGHLHRKFGQDPLSAFFVSVPNRYITNFRTGLRHDCEEDVAALIEKGILSFIRGYSRFFSLALVPIPREEGDTTSPARFFLRPDSYVFEFVKNFIFKSPLGKGLTDKYQESIQLTFPNGDVISYSELLNTAYSQVMRGVSRKSHEIGEAYSLYIEKALETMETGLTGMSEKTLYAAYETLDGSREWRYRFYHDGMVYEIESRGNAYNEDFSLYKRFSGIISRMIQIKLGGDQLKNEDDFAQVLDMFDSICDAEYLISMRHLRFSLYTGSETYSLDASRMTIVNAVNAMKTLSEHRLRFDNFQSYGNAAQLFLNIFTDSGDLFERLRTVRAQGAEVLLQRDANLQYTYSVFGMHLPVPASATCSQLLSLETNPNVLVTSGLMKGRSFDLATQRLRYAFSASECAELLKLPEENASYALDRFTCANLGVNAVIILDKGGLVSDVLESDFTIRNPKLYEQFVLLRTNSSKRETADILERLITGSSKGILADATEFAHSTNPYLPVHSDGLISPVTLTAKELERLRVIEERVEDRQDGVHTGKYNALALYFVKDMDERNYGYGDCCPVCGRKACSLAGVGLRSFHFAVMKDGYERLFKFTLFMCADCMAAGDAWVIDSLAVGSKDPFEWLETAIKGEQVPPEMFSAAFTYREQRTTDFPVDEAQPSDRVFSEAIIRDVALTPLMLAKWVNDNADTME
jgi:hypothetical protein